MNKKQTYISFDFDNTLYNPDTDSIIPEMKALMDEYAKNGYGVCITTLRGENETGRIKDFFPNIPIYPTNGMNKTIALKKYIPVPIAIHYDDDLNICIAIKRFTRIKPVWVRNPRLLKAMEQLKTVDLEP